MSYQYETEKPKLFTEEGQRLFLAIRDKTALLLETSGAARMQEMISGQSGNVWEMLACVDRMIELGELREITHDGVAGQYRVFVRRV